VQEPHHHRRIITGDDMSKKKTKKRVSPSEDQPLSDTALESVAGGCQIGCSNEKTCIDIMSGDVDRLTVLQQAGGL